METTLYTLTFLPMVLLALVVHEAGHFFAARTLGLKATGFQIGVGPRLIARRVGRTTYSLPPAAPTHPRPSPGESVILQLTEDPSARAQHAVKAWTYLSNQASHRAKQMAAEGPCLSATVIRTTNDTITVRDTTLSIAAIPLMAMVYLAEDPSNTNRGFINTAPWLTRITTILAGVGANLALLTATIFVLAIAPITQPGQQVVTISETLPHSPAAQAGILPNDAVMNVSGQVWPDRNKFLQAVEEAHQAQAPLELTLQRNRNIVPVRLHPDPATGKIGVRLQAGVIAGTKGSSIQQRFWRLSEIYFTAPAALIQPQKPTSEADQRRFTGLISAAQYTGQAVQTAKLKAWVAMLGVITFSMAMINLIPLPPLDGFQLVTHTIKSLRKGKAIDPKTETALAFSGLSLLAGLAVYLAVEDILQILGL